jgi:GeoRSP system PqqD family protein
MTRSFDLDAKVRRNPAALWRDFEHEAAVILPSATAVRTLNEVGARCWQLADGRTVGEIVDVLLGEFDVERDQLEKDVRRFFSELDARGLLDGGAA